MNLKKIKEILNHPDRGDKEKEILIFYELARDEKAIPRLLDILNIERQLKSECLKDMNLELSRAHIYIDEHCIDDKKEKQITRPFILDGISKFYIKYQGMVTHVFNRFVKNV